MRKILLLLLEAVALAVFILAGATLFDNYAVTDYKQRMAKRQLILDEARYYKTHPLVLNGCETDLECEQLDAMLEVIHASYTLD